MTTKEELLRDKTYKEENLDVGVRVFYTLTKGTERSIEPSALTQLNTAKLLSLLIEHLAYSGKLTDSEIDELLFKLIT